MGINSSEAQHGGPIGSCDLRTPVSSWLLSIQWQASLETQDEKHVCLELDLSRGPFYLGEGEAPASYFLPQVTGAVLTTGPL